MNNAQIMFLGSIAMLMVLAAIFIREPAEPRCSLDGGSRFYKAAVLVVGIALVSISLVNL